MSTNRHASGINFYKLKAQSGLGFSSTSCNSPKVLLNQPLVNAQHRHFTDWHNDNFTAFGLTLKHDYPTIHHMHVRPRPCPDPHPFRVPVSLPVPIPSRHVTIHCTVHLLSRPLSVLSSLPSHSRLVPTLCPVLDPVPVRSLSYLLNYLLSPSIFVILKPLSSDSNSNHYNTIQRLKSSQYKAHASKFV